METLTKKKLLPIQFPRLRRIILTLWGKNDYITNSQVFQMCNLRYIFKHKFPTIDVL